MWLDDLVVQYGSVRSMWCTFLKSIFLIYTDQSLCDLQCNVYRDPEYNLFDIQDVSKRYYIKRLTHKWNSKLT